MTLAARLSAALLWAVVGAAPPPPPPVPSAPIQLTRQAARWTGIGGTDGLADHTADYFVISGELRNVGRMPIAYVKLRFELLDHDGAVVASEYGYNHRAEDLRGPDYEDGRVSRAALHIPPLAPGKRDSFRMLFIRGQIPPFDHWRVRILEAAPAP